jgi:hypothetical protein
VLCDVISVVAEFMVRMLLRWATVGLEWFGMVAMAPVREQAHPRGMLLDRTHADINRYQAKTGRGIQQRTKQQHSWYGEKSIIPMCPTMIGPSHQ